MDQRDAWRMYFGCVAGIRFHPRNRVESLEDINHELQLAAHIADEMVRIEEETWQSDGAWQQPQSSTPARRPTEAAPQTQRTDTFNASNSNGRR